MFNNKTLIVIGAGASQEANLPTGNELKQRIAKLLDIRFDEDGYHQSSGDVLITDALREYVRVLNPKLSDINPHLRAAWRIRDAMPLAISIDNFIDAHQGDEEVELCGKLAIVLSILEAEKKSLIYFDQKKAAASIDYQSLDGTWFTSFMQLLTENCRRDGLPKRLSSLTLIVFNYDRCIEHFLYHSLQTYYGLTAKEAAEIGQSIEIYHPYGTVGHLPWQQPGISIDFGAKPHSTQLLTLARQIKTFAEGTDPDSSEVVTIRQKLREADIILFLGFAFHGMNLDLLRPAINSTHDSRTIAYFATAKGISESDCAIIRTELKRLNGTDARSIELRNDLACSQLFQEYWRSLSLS